MLAVVEEAKKREKPPTHEPGIIATVGGSGRVTWKLVGPLGGFQGTGGARAGPGSTVYRR